MLMFILIAVLIIYAYYRYNREYQKHHGRLKNFVGPREIPFIGCDVVFCSTTELLPKLQQYMKDYNDLCKVRLGPIRPVLFTADLKLLELLLTSSRNIEKSLDYRFLYKWLGTGLLTGGGAKWRKHRKLITPAFHFGVLEGAIDVFNSCNNIFIQKLKKELGKDSFDIYPYLTLLSLDIICESAMGTSINAQDNSESEYVKCVKRMNLTVIERTLSVLKMYDFFYQFTKTCREEKRALNILHGVTKSVIKSRRHQIAGTESDFQDDFNFRRHKSFIDILLQAKDSNGEPLSDNDIREEVDTFMFEGHDTVSSTLGFLVYSVAAHPEIQNKILDELDSIFGNDYYRECTMHDLQSMNYMEMVIKETLRLHPAVPFYARELQEDLQYGDKILPKGASVTMVAFCLHRNPNIYEDPEKFDPERFRADVQRSPFAYIPFSAGPRNCIGQKYAFLEMKTTLSHILRHYELLLAIPETKPILSAEVVLKSINGIRIRIKERRRQ